MAERPEPEARNQPSPSAAGDEPGADLRHTAKLAGTALLHHVCTGLLVAAALALGVWAVLAPPDGASPTETGTQPTPIERARVTSSRVRLEWALEVHRIDHGEYPESLERLADRGLVRASDLSYPLESRNWTYAPSPEGFRLTDRSRE